MKIYFIRHGKGAAGVISLLFVVKAFGGSSRRQILQANVFTCAGKYDILFRKRSNASTFYR